MSTNFQLLKEMKKRVLASVACVDSLIGVPPESERFNNLLEVALQQQEMACIEMRRLYWQLKSKEETKTEREISLMLISVICSISSTPYSQGKAFCSFNFVMPSGVSVLLTGSMSVAPEPSDFLIHSFLSGL